MLRTVEINSHREYQKEFSKLLKHGTKPALKGKDVWEKNIYLGMFVPIVNVLKIVIMQLKKLEDFFVHCTTFSALAFKS